MASTAATLLAAFNGKPSTSPGNNYGGYNPFGTGVNSGSASSTGTGITDPGSQAQNDVAQSQASYQAQQSNAQSQLQAALSPASVGGGAGIGTQQPGNSTGSGQSLDPFAEFNSQISGIQQRGVDATALAQQTAQQQFQNKLSGLAQQYKNNMANPATWTDSEIQSMLQKMPGFQQSSSLGNYSNYVSNLPAGTDPNSIGARAIAIAKQSLGVPYVYGGNSLTQGVDCSGLVQQVYERLGIQLPRTSTEQAKAGKVVPSLSQALPGDLILMYSPYEPAGLQQYGHVGLYIGNGMMLDAPHTGAVVRIEPIVNMTGIVRPW